MNVNKIMKMLRVFASERDWEKFHSPKNLAMALSVEASELVEIFQWLSEEESELSNLDDANLDRAKEEIADILIYLIRISDELKIDLESAVKNKLSINEAKYPVESSKGSSLKYNRKTGLNMLHKFAEHRIIIIQVALISGLLIISCSKDPTSSNTPNNASCGVDTNFTISLPAIDVAKYSDCRYIVAGIHGAEIIDESGNILPSWEESTTRVPSTRGFSPTSDGGYLTSYINFVSKSSPPNEPGNGWTWFIPEYQAPHYVNDAIETSDGNYVAVGWLVVIREQGA